MKTLSLISFTLTIVCRPVSADVIPYSIIDISNNYILIQHGQCARSAIDHYLFAGPLTGSTKIMCSFAPFLQLYGINLTKILISCC
jgi:hypothetical protein